MKKIKLLSFFLLSHFFLIKAQKPIIYKHKQVEERLKGVKSKIDDLGMFINFRTIFFTSIEKNILRDPYFSVNQIRLDIVGKINDKTSYQFKQRLNKNTTSNNPSFIDKLSRATDLAFIKYNINNKLSITAGKQAIALGITQFDYNSLEVYKYSDIIQNMEAFYTGLGFNYRPVKKHQFQLQILNNYINNLPKIDNKTINQDNENNFISSLGYSFNWNAFWKKNKIHTKSSYSIFQDKKDKYWEILALGAQFNFLSLTVDADYIYSDEDINRQTYKINSLYKVLNTKKYKLTSNLFYNSYMLKIKYKLNSHWDAFVKGIYNTACYCNYPNNNKLSEDFGKFYDYLCGVEYHPFKDINNFKIYALYENHQTEYINPIKSLNKNTHSFSMGLSYRIKVF